MVILSTLKSQIPNLRERQRYLKHYSTYFMSCSFKDWCRRQQIKELLCNNGYVIEQVPNPLRLNAYKDEEWFLIDVWDDSIGLMQFAKGDKTGIASENRPYWADTIRLIHTTGELVLTPFNSIHYENGRGQERN